MAREQALRALVADRDLADRVGKRRAPADDVGDAGHGTDAEEAVHERSAQVEVDDRDTPSSARERNAEVADRGRLPLLLDGGRDHDRPMLAIEVRELDIPA